MTQRGKHPSARSRARNMAAWLLSLTLITGLLLAPALPWPADRPGLYTVEAAEQTYTVVSGDSWWKIGQRFAVDYNYLASYNGKTASQTLYIGQVLKITSAGTSPAPTKAPAPTAAPAQTYTVQPGDSWWLIGQKFGINYLTLAAYNGMTANSTLYAGQVLKLPGRTAPADPGPNRGPTPTPPPPPSGGTLAGLSVIGQAARSAPSVAAQTGIYNQPGTYVTLRPTTYYLGVNTSPIRALGAGSYVFVGSIHYSGSNIWGKSHTGAFFPIKIGSTVYMEKRPDPGYQAPPAVPAGLFSVTQMPTTIWNGIGMGYIIRTPGGKTVVIDGGFQTLNDAATGTLSGYGSGEEAGLLAFLAKNSGSRIDTLIWTHLHNDHINTTAALIQKGTVAVGQLLASRYAAKTYSDQSAAEKQYAESALTKMQNAGKYQNLTRGSVINIDGLKIEVLSARTDASNQNDNSLVLKLTFVTTGRTMLMTGDIGVGMQDTLINSYGTGLKADILQMSHHGNDDLIRLYSIVKPSILLVPVSRQNISLNPYVTDYISKVKNSSGAQVFTAEDRWVTITVR